MALEITYWTGYDPITRQCYGMNISRVLSTLTASSANQGTIPENATIARLKAGEACVVSNNGTAASATNGVGLGVDETIDIEVHPGTPLLAKTE